MVSPILSDEEQRKFLNDYELRALIEQNVEVRHQDTVGVAVSALTAVVVVNVLGGIVLPDRTSFSSLDANQAAVSQSMGIKVRMALPLFGLVIMLIGALLKQNCNLALERIKMLYNSLSSRNDLPQDSLIKLQIINSKSLHRALIPATLFWAGILITLASSFVAITFEVAPIVRHMLLNP